MVLKGPFKKWCGETTKHRAVPPRTSNSEAIPPLSGKDQGKDGLPDPGFPDIEIKES